MENATSLIERLERLDTAGSAGPWYVRYLKDDACMNAVAISTVQDDGRVHYDWREDELVAACLIQYPGYVIPSDARWDENAELIVAVRNALPELLRLAKLGLVADRR